MTVKGVLGLAKERSVPPSENKLDSRRSDAPLEGYQHTWSGQEKQREVVLLLIPTCQDPAES